MYYGGFSMQQTQTLSDQQFRQLLDPHFIKDHLEIRIIPETQINTYSGCLKTFDNLDFALALAVRVSDEIGVKINESFLDAVQTDFNTLWNLWLDSDIDNIRLESMSSILSSFLIDTTNPEIENNILICDYAANSPGAGVVFHPSVQQKILDMEPYRNGFHIIFSSIYEAMIIPLSFPVRDLQEILLTANSTPDIVQTDEIASNFVYDCLSVGCLEKVVITNDAQ